MDAGNVWASPGQYNPTRLFRGAGVGVSLLSPLGPIGIDYAYGFDRVNQAGNPDPGWKFHFKLGNFF
jgi:outer membrane protein insertion porin family